MPHAQLEWIKAGTGDRQKLRSMIVGWQTVREIVNSLVLGFNREFLKSPDEKAADRDHGMREMALKRLIISVLFELDSRLNNLIGGLRKHELISEHSMGIKRSSQHLFDRVAEWKNIRVMTLHLLDPIRDGNTPTAKDLVELYEAVDSIAIDEIDAIRRAMMDLGEALLLDAVNRC